MTRLLAKLVLLISLLVSPVALAGSAAADKPTLPMAKVAAFTDSLQQDLAARGANIAIVARVGRARADLPDGIAFTHVAYWVYSRIERADGTAHLGYRAYNLYQLADDPTTSRLIQDSPAEFFAGAHRLEAGVIIPDARLQRKLLEVIASPTYAALHNPHYSVLANPRTGQFQNCTEHTLDVLMASLYGTSDKAQIKANIAAHFPAQQVKIGGAKRLLAPALSGAYSTADHGPRIETATFGAIARFMAEHDLSEQIYRYTLNGAEGFGS